MLLPAAASALFGGKAAADAYSTAQAQLDVEAGHKRAERRCGREWALSVNCCSCSASHASLSVIKLLVNVGYAAG